MSSAAASTKNRACTTDLIFQRLAIQAPRDYRRWLRVAIAATLAGYAVAFASIQLEQPWPTQSHPREPYVIGVCLLAAWMERRGRLRTAAALVVTAIWVEMHISLVLHGPRAAVGGVFPAVVTGVFLFFGSRAGRFVALSCLFSAPLSAHLGGFFGVGPGIAEGDLLFLVVLVGPTLGIAFLLSRLMRTLERVLENAERDAQRVRELIDGAPDAILVVNQDGLIEDCNPSAESLFERHRGELLGSPLGALGLEDAERRGAAAVNVGALGPEPRELVVPLPSATGGTGHREVSVEGVARTVSRADGSRDALVVLRDLTPRKAAERRTASLQRQLQHSQKLEALGKLAGGVAHDFNNLLMAVGGYGEALARHQDARVREIAHNLIGLKQRASGLTGHLLAFARKGMTQPRSMDLAQAVNEMPRVLGPLVGPHITLRIDAPEPAFICADPAQIEQVLLNLALNARDAMPDGGTLSIGCRKCPELSRVELMVSDTGHGMDEATRKQAFEPFFTTKPKSQGTGLGLALVQGILEASGGTVEVRSTPGSGTCFSLSWRGIGEARSADPAWPKPARGSAESQN